MFQSWGATTEKAMLRGTICIPPGNEEGEAMVPVQVVSHFIVTLRSDTIDLAWVIKGGSTLNWAQKQI